MYCIGLISGTSVDGIDAVLVEIAGTDFEIQVTQVAGATFAYPTQLREQILAVCGGASLSMPEFAQLDDAIATQFAHSAQKIQKGHPTAQLIGSHGQTVFHRPPLLSVTSDQLPVTNRGAWRAPKQPVGAHGVRPTYGVLPPHDALPNSGPSIGYSLQLGRGAVIAELTGTPVVSNFRAADIAAGGEGAPLVSKIDVCLLSDPTLDRCVQNLGGIGNVTYLPARNSDNWERNICGWDTGPANALIDLAVSKLTDGKLTFDKDGSWAARGTPSQELVERWLQQDFFQQSPPKSTGRELFSPEYLEACWQEAQPYQLNDADWLATITELTVASVVHSYQTFLPRMPDEVLLCGGGSRNRYLKQRLEARLAGSSKVLTTDEAGVNGDFKEAIAFAVLAYWRFHCSFAGNLPQVTGAKQPVLLGEINLPITN